ncbi:TRAP transporter substrate-binding protein [Aquabacterium sp. A08]|uniref:TRAP transporter substrate-binding protein n=1 Tax=Aquabacterium sp. A08 TaxID=2718532 RepID=UPI0014216EA7|nr:TRAP transporter substrate-binding protein [Aquabacterium sp. A08]NIC41779.1 TRAP transporter substrate-binding protein [Aquabacterium sp. A08]NIC41808.1 TRAP transporter substrate-binding protein [Aquabacterium sp. A08]
MDRRSLIAGSGAIGLAGLLAACGKKEEAAAPAAAPAAPAVATGDTVRWRIASSFPKALDTIYGGAEVFAKAVNDMSGGKFQISVHPGGELVPPFGVVDAVQQGTVEAAHTCAYYHIGKDDTFAMGTAIPFGLNSRQLTSWMYHGNGLKLFREFYDQYNIINFPCGNSGAQMGGWFRKEIKGVGDINGLKMRLGGFAGKVLSRLGAVPQAIPGGEIYQALERGTIDACEWVGPYDDEKLGFNKVAPFYYYPGWWEGGAQIDLYINKEAYNKLSAENKAIVEAAAAYAHTDMQAKYDALNPPALKRLVASGTKVLPFPKSTMDAAFKAANELYTELSDTNANWKKIYSDYAEFRRDQNLWFRFTEGLFDNYMQNSRL